MAGIAETRQIEPADIPTAFDDQERTIALARQKRRARIEAWEDYIGFITAKLGGLGLIVLGGLESLTPDALQQIVLSPDYGFGMAGIGLALLGGKPILSALGNLADVVAKYREQQK